MDMAKPMTNQGNKQDELSEDCDHPISNARDKEQHDSMDTDGNLKTYMEPETHMKKQYKNCQLKLFATVGSPFFVISL